MPTPLAAGSADARFGEAQPQAQRKTDRYENVRSRVGSDMTYTWAVGLILLGTRQR